MAQQKELPWIAEARKYIGLTEIPGKNHNPTILNWLHGLKAWWKNDETPWCGVFAAHCLRAGNRDIPKDWMRAKEYAFAVNALTSLLTAVWSCLHVKAAVMLGLLSARTRRVICWFWAAIKATASASQHFRRPAWLRMYGRLSAVRRLTPLRSVTTCHWAVRQ